MSGENVSTQVVAPEQIGFVSGLGQQAGLVATSASAAAGQAAARAKKMSKQAAKAAKRAGKVASAYSPMFVALIPVVMYFIALFVDNQCVKDDQPKTFKTMQWLLTIILTILITLIATILMASRDGTVSLGLKKGAAILTALCSLIGSSYGIWATMKCDSASKPIKNTRIAFYSISMLVAIPFALLSSRV
jgi:cytochrome bd-type quinol oxidase subunit 2